jgi:hypothetical protein
MTVDFVDSYQPRIKKYSLTDTSTSIAGASSTTLSVTVGTGYAGGNYTARSTLAYSPGNVAGCYGNLRASSSSSDQATSACVNGPYSSIYNSAVDSRLSEAMFDNAGGTIQLTNAYYEASTGIVKFTFQNTNVAAKTISVRIEGIVWA